MLMIQIYNTKLKKQEEYVQFIFVNKLNITIYT